MPWFAIRAVYRHAQEPDGIYTYEERLLLFRADGVGEAFALAEDESRRYLELNPGFQRIGEWIAFGVNADDGELNGSELWSSLARSELAASHVRRLLRNDLAT
jgi:hypothetical protein